jgi:aldose 1-epimerase
MRFTIDRYRKDDLSLLRLQDNATGAMVTILPSSGALLHSFEIPLQGKNFNVIDNYADSADLTENLTTSYKSAKLSPFACRIPGGQYIFQDQEYEFDNKFPDGSAIHGLLANKPFNLLEQFADDQMAIASFRYHYKQEDPGYPFDYVCEVKYTLFPDHVLQLQTTVLNLGDHTIPMADGWHPYFTLGDTVNDYEMQFNSDTMLEFNSKLIPTGNFIKDPVFLEPVVLGNRSIDNCFQLNPTTEDYPCCALHNPHNGLTVSFYSSANYPYLQIYTPDHRKSIAIENLSGAPDCFNNGMGLLLLEPRHSATFNVRYRVSVK